MNQQVNSFFSFCPKNSLEHTLDKINPIHQERQKYSMQKKLYEIMQITQMTL